MPIEVNKCQVTKAIITNKNHYKPEPVKPVKIGQNGKTEKKRGKNKKNSPKFEICCSVWYN